TTPVYAVSNRNPHFNTGDSGVERMSTATNNRASAVNKNHNSITPSNIVHFPSWENRGRMPADRTRSGEDNGRVQAHPNDPTATRRVRSVWQLLSPLMGTPIGTFPENRFQ